MVETPGGDHVEAQLVETPSTHDGVTKSSFKGAIRSYSVSL
jgi:hypothetical protein